MGNKNKKKVCIKDGQIIKVSPLATVRTSCSPASIIHRTFSQPEQDDFDFRHIFSSVFTNDNFNYMDRRNAFEQNKPEIIKKLEQEGMPTRQKKIPRFKIRTDVDVKIDYIIGKLIGHVSNIRLNSVKKKLATQAEYLKKVSLEKIDEIIDKEKEAAKARRLIERDNAQKALRKSLLDLL